MYIHIYLFMIMRMDLRELFDNIVNQAFFLVILISDEVKYLTICSIHVSLLFFQWSVSSRHWWFKVKANYIHTI